MDLILAVAGDRHYSDYRFFSKIMRDEMERFSPGRILTGDCTGVDTMALMWALVEGVPLTVYCASIEKYKRLMRDGVDARAISDWRYHGKAAGPIRNHKMISDCQRLLLFDGGGSGSASGRKLAESMGKQLERWEIHRGLSPVCN